MLELGTLGPLMTIALLCAIAAVASYGVTEVLKRFMTAYKDSHREDPDRPGDRPWWWNPGCRSLAIAVGSGVGFALMPTMVGAGLGLAAGALNTAIVKLVKDKMKRVADKAIDQTK